MSYILEVQKFIQHPLENKGFQHVGYMKRSFKTKKEACEYYDLHNPRMRKLNAHNTYISDWDPDTHLRYVVRSFDREILTIEPFNPNHTYGVIEKSKNSVTVGNIEK
jgi:hypothetical protein